MKSCDLNVTAADENPKFARTDEETFTFLDLVEETNVSAILDGKQQLAFDYVITLLCLLLLW